LHRLPFFSRAVIADASQSYGFILLSRNSSIPPVIRNPTMTRISSLLVASAFAILPITAFAQPTSAPVKAAAPTTMTTAAPVTSKANAPAVTADATKPAKTDVKTPAAGAKSDVHSSNTVKTHHAKTNVPAKSAEPAKS
jgi:hypothetical protein